MKENYEFSTSILCRHTMTSPLFYISTNPFEIKSLMLFSWLGLIN